MENFQITQLLRKLLEEQASMNRMIIRLFKQQQQDFTMSKSAQYGPTTDNHILHMIDLSWKVWTAAEWGILNMPVVRKSLLHSAG